MGAIAGRFDLPTAEWATLMFTDIEGSTLLIQNHPGVFFAVIDRHFEILRRNTQQYGGTVVVAHSDALFARFGSAEDALQAAIATQRDLSSEEWPDAVALKVRMGLHTGEVHPVSDPRIGYVGIDVHRAARISEAANGGQILASSSTIAELDRDRVDAGTTFHFLGSHRLKDLSFPEHLYEVRVPDLLTGFPPIKSIDNRPTNLPKTTSAFYGRQHDLGAISEQLTTDHKRLVTLTGPGGAGKTRLAIEVAQSLVASYGDGVFMVTLGSVARPSLVLPAIAQTLGVPEYRGRTVLEGLTHFLSRRHILLVVDNFEHLMDASADMRTLLDACPQLDLLVTTREPLHLAGEFVYPVAPLPLPGSPNEDAALCDSVQMFADRARSVRRDFVLDSQTTPLVASICKRLDGLPLAIELAASRLRVLSLRELSERLNDSLSMIGKLYEDADRRHTTLNDAISWSYRLLNTDEQACLAKMSLFRGGFNLPAGEHVCGAHMPSGALFVDILMSLCDKNLLLTNTAGGSARFVMLETVREFALAKLDASGDAHSCKNRHADFYLRLVEALSSGLVGSDQRRRISELQMEMDNVRAALGWCLDQADFSRVSRYLQSLLWYLIPRAQFSEGLLWTERALAVASEIRTSHEFAVLNDVAGWLKLISGDYGGARPHFEITYEIFKAVGSRGDIAKSMITLGISTAITVEGDEGPNLIISALELCRELNDPHAVGTALIALGEGARAGGGLEMAMQCYDEALTLMRQCDDQYWTGALLMNMCHVALTTGDLDGAQKYLGEAIALANEYDYTMMINLYVAVAGELALKRGNPEDAARLFGAATALLHDVGITFEPADQAEFDKAIALASSELGSGQFNELLAEGVSWERGRALDFAAKVAGVEN
jgi:predicted ATPase/class 3 adenylate cyclase